MFTNLQTERLNLKCIGPEDAPFFYKEFSNDEVNRYLYDAEPCASEAEAMQWIDLYCRPEPRDAHRWVLIVKRTGEKIGTCGFHCRNQEENSVETGYDLLPEYRKKGYMTEAMAAILTFAVQEMQIKKVYAHISVDNTASARLSEKLGFVRTGEQYNEVFRGEEYPHDIFAWVPKEKDREIRIERLTKENFNPKSLDTYDRTQHVKKVYRRVNGEYTLVDCPYTEFWNLQELRKNAAEIAAEDMITYLALDGRTVVGFISLHKQLHGEYMILEQMQVSNACRGHGVGRRLFACGREEAVHAGAKALYISACSSEETIAFYHAMGAEVTEDPIPEYAEKEPCDLQMTAAV